MILVTIFSIDFKTIYLVYVQEYGLNVSTVAVNSLSIMGNDRVVDYLLTFVEHSSGRIPGDFFILLDPEVTA